MQYQIKTILRRVLLRETIIKQLEDNGYDYGIAFATKQEVENGAACGQLAIITEEGKVNESL
jgi:hypothetical protein